MASNTGVECVVCFNSNYKFKLLDCGHEFCAKCCQKLSKPVAPTLLKIGTPIAVSQLVAQTGIECPKCRSVTNVVNGDIDALKTHFIGSIMCYQCDTEKLTKEFRWCHTCNRSVCSTCFIDKHINVDGSGFHEASKWDSHMSVKSAVNRLRQMSLDHKQITEKCKSDVTKYLDGLNIYLTRKIDETAKANQGSHSSMADTIANAYGISKEEISTSKPIPDDMFCYALNEAKKVAQVGNSTADLVEVHFQQFPYEQLEKTFLQMNVSPPKSSEFNRLSNLQSKLLNTESIGLDKISSPIDLAVLGSKEAIILDTTGPFHYCNNLCQLISLQSENGTAPGMYYNQHGNYYMTAPVFGNVLVNPHNKTQLIVTGNFGSNRFIVLTKEINGKYTHWRHTDGSLSWPLPGSSDKVTASTTRIYTFSNNSLYAYNHNDKMDFSVIFQSAYAHAQFKELCHVQEEPTTTAFYLFGNPEWKQLEIVQLDRKSNSLVSWKKMNLRLLCPELQFTRPMMCAYVIPGLYLIGDQLLNKLYTWNVKTNACALIADFNSQSPQAIHFYDNSMYMLLREFDVNRVELVEL